MYTLTFSNKALDGLDEILGYVEEQFGTRVAEDINAEILTVIERLGASHTVGNE